MFISFILACTSNTFCQVAHLCPAHMLLCCLLWLICDSAVEFPLKGNEIQLKGFLFLHTVTVRRLHFQTTEALWNNKILLFSLKYPRRSIAYSHWLCYTVQNHCLWILVIYLVIVKKNRIKWSPYCICTLPACPNPSGSQHESLIDLLAGPWGYWPNVSFEMQESRSPSNVDLLWNVLLLIRDFGFATTQPAERQLI